MAKMLSGFFHFYSIFVFVMFSLSYQLDEIQSAAQWLLEQAGKPGVWVLDGDLGAGKTTLVAALCHELGIQDHVSSPTFGLVHEYQLSKGQRLHHLDLYRVSSELELIDSGIAELIQSGEPCLIEWGSRFSSILPVCYWHLMINFVNQTQRHITLTQHE